MNTGIDIASTSLLRGLIGRTIRRITGVRYPAVVGYSEVRLHDESGVTTSLQLRAVQVHDGFEVCVPTVRSVTSFDEPTAVDLFELTGFHVARVFRLQRREFVAQLPMEVTDYVGSHPREQFFVVAGADANAESQLVDVGVALESRDGLTLELCADSFPLLYQLRLTVAASVIPNSQRAALA